MVRVIPPWAAASHDQKSCHEIFYLKKKGKRGKGGVFSGEDEKKERNWHKWKVKKSPEKTFSAPISNMGARDWSNTSRVRESLHRRALAVGFAEALEAIRYGKKRHLPSIWFDSVTKRCKQSRLIPLNGFLSSEKKGKVEKRVEVKMGRKTGKTS